MARKYDINRGCRVGSGEPLAYTADEEATLSNEEEMREVVSAVMEQQQFVVSAGVMEAMQRRTENDTKWRAMNDSGANVNIGPKWLAKELQLSIFPHLDARGIGTAKSDIILDIIGRIYPGGYAGGIALVEEATLF